MNEPYSMNEKAAKVIMNMKYFRWKEQETLNENEKAVTRVDIVIQTRRAQLRSRYFGGGWLGG